MFWSALVQQEVNEANELKELEVPTLHIYKALENTELSLLLQCDSSISYMQFLEELS